MSGFEVYLLFQISKIAFFFTITGCLGLSITSFVVFFHWMELGSFPRQAIKFYILAGVFSLLGVFTPTTTTLAAMLVIPKVTTPEALNKMTKESNSLYVLAKKALQNAINTNHNDEENEND